MDKKFCKVTFFADLTADDRQFMLSDFAQAMTEAAQIDSVCGVTVADPDDDRTEELLNNLIDHISLGRSTSETISTLIDCGFNRNDLIAYGYNEDDILHTEEGDVEEW